MPDQTNKDPYFIDFPKRIKSIQEMMKEQGISVYLGSRLRTISWTADVFCPWRSYIVIPKKGIPTVYTFLIDAARIGHDSWLDEDHVLGYGPIGGMDQIDILSEKILECLDEGEGKVGVESGLSNYLPEGNLTHYEYEKLEEALPDVELVNAIDIVDKLSLIKDEGTMNRFREASRIVDIGHHAVYDAIKDGGYKGMTEAEIAGIADYHMRKAGSEFTWSFTGGNEIASGYRTGFNQGACTPATRKKLEAGEPLMVDLHAMFKLGLGDHTHNYLLDPATDRQKWHAQNFVDLVNLILKAYGPGATPCSLADKMIEFAEDHDFTEFMVPGCEHGIGMMGDEWRVGMNDGPFEYWTNPDHVYQTGEMVICAMQYASPDENIGFRYENPIIITGKGCEYLSKFPLRVEVI